jgi:hypothetical protein
MYWSLRNKKLEFRMRNDYWLKNDRIFGEIWFSTSRDKYRRRKMNPNVRMIHTTGQYVPK